ncbi:unnamed protein product [Schistosoma guineensis]|nr:unnamed protein product [Schistosoma guineensis]
MNKTLEKLSEITYVMIDVENHPNSVFYIVIKRIPGSLLEMEELRLHVYFTVDIMQNNKTRFTYVLYTISVEIDKDFNSWEDTKILSLNFSNHK